MSDDEEYEYEYGSDAEYDGYGSDHDQNEEGGEKDLAIEIENSYYGTLVCPLPCFC